MIPLRSKLRFNFYQRRDFKSGYFYLHVTTEGMFLLRHVTAEHSGT
jgi:hypothetical protein